MELNYDFVRDMLLECANSTNPYGPSNDEVRSFAESKNVTIEELAYTVDCLHQAGLITNKAARASAVPYMFTPGNLTWKGNEYLNSIRSKSVWNETKVKLKSAGITASLELVGELATSVIKSKLGLS